MHRLDKDTSGLMIVAKTNKAHINLSNQIKERKVVKIYTALIRGILKEDQATIDMPIGRSLNDRKKMAVRKDGKKAITHIKVEKRYDKYTLIKVHMAQIGYPIVGDEIYSNGKNEFGIHGQMLHSTILEFMHPITGEKMHFESELPKYFRDIIDKLDKQIKQN